MSRVPFRLLVIAVLAASAAACGPGTEMSPGPSAPSSLEGTAWRAMSVSGAPPVAGREPTLVFTADQVNGTTGCNQFFGGYTYADGAITLSNVGMTLMACDDAVNGVEAAYTKALNGAATAAVDSDGRLLLSGSGGQVLFVPVSD
jgi:heat shock protein HslJ